ncbi:MAG: trigger factor [Candidatus Rokubacteria bacterium]|nr:trigger factor [Candidatus Rokubacteria bacterium]
MKVDVEELGACKRRLSIEETPEVVQKAWEQAFTRVQREARLPGFRKGKLPRSMVKLHFADDVRQEVARQLIPDVYRQAIAETQLKPVEEPDFQEVTLEENAALRVSAVVEIKPRIALGAYTGLAVRHTPKPFEDTEVDEALSHLREQHAEFRTVERAADLGDLVIIDYTITPEGLPARTESGHSFVVGGGSVYPQIEEAVIGLVPGGAREAHFRFPEDHRNEALRGKPAQAQVKVIEVKEKVLPALDDDFARTVGSFESLDGLRAELRTGLEKRREQENRRALEEAVVQAALAAHEFAVPEAMVLRQVGAQIEHMKEGFRRNGMDPERVPWDYPKLLEELRPGATATMRRLLLLEAIAEAEGFAPTAAEVDAEVERIAQAGQRPAPAVRRLMEQSGDLDALRLSLRERKTVEFLVEHAQVTS